MSTYTIDPAGFIGLGEQLRNWGTELNSADPLGATQPHSEPQSGNYYSCYYCGYGFDPNTQAVRKYPKDNRYVMSFHEDCARRIVPFKP